MKMSKKIAILAEQGIFSGTSFFVNIALASQIGIYQYGLFASLTIALYLLLGISQALIIQPMQTYLAKCPEHASYKSFLLIALLFLTTGMVIVYIFINSLPFEVLANYREFTFSFILYIYSFLIFDFLRKYFLAIDKVAVNLFNAAVYAVTLSSVSILVFYNQITDLSDIFLLLAFSHLPSIIIFLLNFIKGTIEFQLPQMKNHLKYHLKEGKWLMYASLVQWSSSNIFLLSSGVIVGIEALGVLKYFQTLFGVINILLQGIENFVLPKLSRAYSTSTEACYSEFQKLFGGFLSILILGLIIIAVFSNPLLSLFAKETISKYYQVLSALAVLYLIILIGYPLRLIIRILDLNKYYFIAYLLSFVFSLLTYQLLLQEFGIVGAVIGLIINQLILQSVWLYILNKKQFKVWKLYIS